MNLYLITFQSSLNRIESVYDCHKDLFVEIEKFFTLHLVPYTEAASIPADAYRMAFIASGGVEKMVTQRLSNAHPTQNFKISEKFWPIQHSFNAEGAYPTFIQQIKTFIQHGPCRIPVTKWLTLFQKRFKKRSKNVQQTL